MARPRKYKVDIPGLSCFTDARTKKVYWRYKHPVTGKFHGLGTDEAAAKAIATEANERLAQRQLSQLLKARDEISRSAGKSISDHSFDASRVARTSTETRPRNIAFNYIVRAA